MAERQENMGRVATRRQDVIATRRRHGISGTVAAGLWMIAQDLRRRTRRRGLEHAVTVDSESGEQIGSMLTGTASSTDISPHLRAIQPNRSYVVLHTHPLSTSFSDRDVRVLAEHEALKTMIAVGTDGIWYIMSRQANASQTLGAAIETAYLIERLQLSSARALATETSHRATEHVVALFNWRYDLVHGEMNELANS